MAKKIKTWEDVKEYCFDRLEEIRRINDGHPCPSAFVCIAAFMGFLSRLAYGTNLQSDHGSDGKWFRDFVTNFMPQKYSPQADLMYSTFRCGIVHAMSFDQEIPRDYRGARSDYLASIGGVNRPAAELAITHDDKFAYLCSGDSLLPDEKDGKKGSYVLVASVLCDDIALAIDKMFDNRSVCKNCEEFVKVQRLIDGSVVSPANTGLVNGTPDCHDNGRDMMDDPVCEGSPMLSGSGEL